MVNKKSVATPNHAVAQSNAAKQRQKRGPHSLSAAAAPVATNNNVDDDNKEEPNRPRNLLITDATQPFTFTFSHGGATKTTTSITVHQTPEEETWPGGALWDLGVLLAHVLVALSHGGQTNVTLTSDSTTGEISRGKKTIHRSIILPSRMQGLINGFFQNRNSPLHQKTLLELGCGVGLTGLVAAAAIEPKLSILTDLPVVIDRVTVPNVERNFTIAASSGTSAGRSLDSRPGPRPRTIHKKGHAKIVAVPLSWGNAMDEQLVKNIFHFYSTPLLSKHGRHKKGAISQSEEASFYGVIDGGTPLPSIILIGDVAYQHKPGADSHFDALLSTLLEFTTTSSNSKHGENSNNNYDGNSCDDSTPLVIFGTRIRMPASHDLLHMLLEHFVELVIPPLEAHEIDPESFLGRKHNMTIHFLTRKKQSPSEAEFKDR